MASPLHDLSRATLAMLVVGMAALVVAAYWFVEAITLPVLDVAQQSVQVLYNIHGAIWALVAVVGFGFAGLFHRLQPRSPKERELADSGASKRRGREPIDRIDPPLHRE